MTRKHYTALARKLYAAKPAVNRRLSDYAIPAGPYCGWWESVRAVADVCEADNDRFDRGRFIKACENGVR